MVREVKRLSLVVYVKEDDQIAREIESAIRSFLKVNYRIKNENIETHFRSVKENRNNFKK